MKAILSVSKFDLRQQATPLTVVLLLAASMPLLAKLSFGQAVYADYLKVLWAMVSAGGVLCLLNCIANIGRSASPLEARNWIHSLPLCRWKLALGKLTFAILVLEILPSLALSLGYLISELVPGLILVNNGPVVSLNAGAFLFNTAFLFWLLLGAAVFRDRWVLLTVPVFVVAEMVSHRVLSPYGFVKSKSPDFTPLWLHPVLLLVLLLALGALFVHYHHKRQRGLVLVGMFVSLLVITGLRVLFGSLLA